MLYEKAAYKELKRKTSRDCMICFGTCSGHKEIDEKEILSILIAEQGIFLERAKGQDAIVLMEHVQNYKQTDSAIVLKTTDPTAKRLTLHIRSQVHRNKGCKILEKYMTPPAPKQDAK
jgi:hypothetical protein